MDQTMKAVIIISIINSLMLIIGFISLKKEIRATQKLIRSFLEKNSLVQNRSGAESKSVDTPQECRGDTAFPTTTSLKKESLATADKKSQQSKVLSKPQGQYHPSSNKIDALVSISKNNTSKKYFIFLEDADESSSKMINPEGKVLILSNDLFGEIEEERLSILIGTKRLSDKQIHAFEAIRVDTSPHPIKSSGCRELGSKGNENLRDYLIPVLKLIYDGSDYIDAFRIISEKLDVRYNTVSAQCTRALNLTTGEFVQKAKDKSIIQILKQKYSDRIDLIEKELCRR